MHKLIWKTLAPLMALGLTVALIGTALADGDETLGAPSIGIASGSAIEVAGAGLFTQPADINITIPAGASIEQVLLYWQQQTVEGDAGDDTLVIEGTEVTGALIGESFGEWDCCLSPNLMHRSYRADVTSLGVIGAGANTVTVSGLDAGNFERKEANGAALLVIYDNDGSAEIDIRDGSDFAYDRSNLSGSLLVTEAQVFSFDAELTDRTATLDLIVADITDPANETRDHAVDVTVNGVTTRHSNPFMTADGQQWDTLRLDVDIPAGIGEVTVQLFSVPDGSNRAESFVWVSAALAVPVTLQTAAGFIIIDEDGIDNDYRYWEEGVTPKPGNAKYFRERGVNEDKPKLGQRDQLRFFRNNVGKIISLQTGEVGDEGWFAPQFIPQSWVNAGPTDDGIRNFVGLPVGKGLGKGNDPEKHLDKIPDVTPLRATGLEGLEGGIYCAVVWDSDISINFDPLDGSLKGENLGIVAFRVLDDGVDRLRKFSSSILPTVEIEIMDADIVCAGPLELVSAPMPPTSSEPFDIDPENPSGGYL